MVLLLAQALADPRVVVGGDHFQAGRRLRGVAANVGIAVELTAVDEHAGDGLGRLSPHSVSEAAGVRIGVEGDDAIATVGGERVAEHQRGGGLAGSALAAEHHHTS